MKRSFENDRMLQLMWSLGILYGNAGDSVMINFARHVIGCANTCELEEALRLLGERDGGAGIVERLCAALPVFKYLGYDYLKARQPIRLRAAATRSKQYVVRSARR